MSKVLELREKRAALVAQARQILDKAETEKRAISTEENTTYEKIMGDVDRLKGEIDREERLAALEKELTTPAGSSTRTAPGSTPENRGGNTSPLATTEYRDAVMDVIRGKRHMNELRSLHVGVDTEGGIFVPDSMETMIRMKLENENVMRRLGTVQPLTTDKDIPFEEDYGEAYWTGEEKAAQESSATFSTKNIKSHKLTALIKVSEELLQDSILNIESYIAAAFARRFGRKEELAFIKGNGANQPRGFILDASVGVTTAANNAITADEMIDLYHSLARYYRVGARWLLADLTAKTIRKLKNAVTGDYLWQPGLQAGQPDILLGKPVEVSDDMDTIAATKKVIAFGDFKEYFIADRKNTSIQRLVELYAVNGQVGFRGVRRVDGRLLRSDSIKVMQMKA